MSTFRRVFLSHIYREQNVHGDRLLKGRVLCVCGSHTIPRVSFCYTYLGWSHKYISGLSYFFLSGCQFFSSRWTSRGLVIGNMDVFFDDHIFKVLHYTCIIFFLFICRVSNIEHRCSTIRLIKIADFTMG